MAMSVAAARRAALLARFPLLAPLADRNFAVFWTGRTVSLAGDQFQTVALAVTALDLTRSASGLGVVLMVQAVPRAVLMLFGGVAVDRLRPRTVMLASDALQSLVVAALALLAFRGLLAFPVLLAYAALSGAAFAFFLPASNTIVPELVPREQVLAANALTNTALNLNLFLVPPLAGLVVAAAGAAPAFALNALSLVGSVITLWCVRLKPSARAEAKQRGGMLTHVREGVAAAARDTPTWLTLLMAVVYCFGFAGATFVGLPALAKLSLGAGDAGVGVLLGARGVGALVGGVLIGNLVLRRSGLVGCLVILGLGAALAGGAVSPTLWQAAGWFALAGGFGTAVGIIFFTLLQTRAPDEHRGAIMALTSLAIFGLSPLAYGVAGLVGSAFSPRGVLLLGAACITISGVMGISSRAMREAP